MLLQRICLGRRRGYGHDLKYHIKVLIDKSCINILDGKVTTTHPLIESMGKEIVRKESPEDPGRRSRLWFSEDIVEVLKNNKVRLLQVIHIFSLTVVDLFSLLYTHVTFFFFFFTILNS